MNENEFEHDGKVYVAVKSPSNIDPCEGCAFDRDLTACANVPIDCYDIENRCEVIFIERQVE